MPITCKQTQNIQDRIIKELEEAPDHKNPAWSDFDTEVVQKYYGKKDARVIAKVLHRTVEAVRAKAHRMGLVEAGRASEI